MTSIHHKKVLSGSVNISEQCTETKSEATGQRLLRTQMTHRISLPSLVTSIVLSCSTEQLSMQTDQSEVLPSAQDVYAEWMEQYRLLTQALVLTVVQDSTLKTGSKV